MQSYLQSPGRRQIFGVIAFTGLLYILLACSCTLFDRDEPRFCRASVEMLETGNWLYPTFNYELRPDKPILFYWLTAPLIKVFGQNSFACRLPSVIALCFNCYLTYVLGRFLFNSRVGFLAMIILPTTLSMIPISIAATADSVLLSFMLATLVLYFQPGGKLSFGRTVAMGLVIGGALLQKGPVGLLPLLVIIFYHILAKFYGLKAESHFFKLFIALLIGCGLFLAWALPANAATDGEFFRLGIGKHVVSRSIKPMEGHGGDFLISLPFYLFVVAIGLFPWNLFLLAGLAYLFRAKDRDKHQRVLLISWIVPIIVLMTLVATKLPHYIIFTWPAFAIVIGSVIDRLWEGDAIQPPSFKHSKFFFNAVLFILIGGVPAFAVLGPIDGLNVTAFYIFALFSAVYLIVAKAHEKEKWNLILSTMVISFVLLVSIVSLGAMAAVDETKIAVEVARRTESRKMEDVPVAVYDYREPSLNFYLDKKIEKFDTEKVISWARSEKAKALIISKEGMDEIAAGRDDFEYKEVFRVYGLDAKLQPIVVLYCLPVGAEHEDTNM